MKSIFVLIALVTIIPVHVYSQSGRVSEVIIAIAEELAADESEPEAVSAFIERLYELAENPVMINSASEEEISRLFFLSDFQIKALADYAHSSGRIISAYELANIPGFDRETAEIIIPFITFESKMIVYPDSVRWRNTLLTNLSIRTGYDDTTSLGSPWKMLTKYKFTAGGFSGGLTVEKDPGETILSADTHLPDFLSAHLAYNGNGLIRRFIVGDYSARFGQGTNINTGIRTGLSLTAPGYMSARDEIKPYTSTDENNFFRGAAAEFSHKNLGLFLFYSKNYVDATLASSSGSSKDYIDNFYLAGIHNTPSLLLKKDVIYEVAYGINLSCNFNNFRIGLVWSGDRFSLPVNSTSFDPESFFDFKGNGNNLYTIYYNGLIKRILLYGEFSTNEFKKFAFVQGLSFRPSDRLTINFLLRNYKAGYISFHGKGPGNSSETGNEQGILGNFTFEAAKHLFISGGSEIQHFPWLKYRCSAPSWGMRQEIRVRFLPTEKLTFDGSYTYRLSMADNPEDNGIPEQKQIIARSLKGSVRYSFFDNLIVGTRIDFKFVEPSGNRGMLLLQDINYRFRSIPVSVWFRYCIFGTDDYESRLYTWENDLLYSFSIPALYGKGSRAYLMAGWKITGRAEFRFKYAICTKNVNPGAGNNTEEFRIQLKVTI